MTMDVIQLSSLLFEKVKSFAKMLDLCYNLCQLYGLMWGISPIGRIWKQGECVWNEKTDGLIGAGTPEESWH